MNWQNITVYTLIALCLFWVGRHVWRHFRKKADPCSGCGCDCTGCEKKRRQEK